MRRGLFTSRSAAQTAIDAGQVTIGGRPALKAATMVSTAEAVEVAGPAARFVSRAGDKLDAAFEVFGINVERRSAIDVGASTGGFTDCLLQRGASSVLSLDVGFGQLDWKLRNDDRVTVMDRTNIRAADPTAVGVFDLVVVDISFISLVKVMHVLARLGHDATDWVMLVKPQFEAGPADVERGGVVTDSAVRDRCIAAVVASAAEHGLRRRDGIDSPVPGAKSGNVEHLLWLQKGPT